MAEGGGVTQDHGPDPYEVSDAETMITNLGTGNELLARSARTALKAAEEAGDQASADLMTQRVAVAEKTAWMLRAMAK
jgi:starvation-inducible DNA-binding protein